nr:hypothetical protein [Tanacetum cinerariifolium]
MAETMEQYVSKTQADYGLGVAGPKIEDKDNFELKGQFLKELRTNTFSDLDHEDTNEHIEKVIEIVTTTDAKVAIQKMAEYYPKWHNGTSRTRSTKTFNGLAAIQAQLDNLGREIKKVNEKFYVAQVGCEQCKGPHYTKYFPLKEEGKTLEEAYYTQFGAPFQGGGYRATALGLYQRNNANPSYQERWKSMEETLSKFMRKSAKRHEENSKSLDLLFGDYIELNDLNVPLELRRDQVDDLMPTIKEGDVIEEFRARNNENDFIVLEDMGTYRDEGMGDVIFDEPFLREVRINAKWFEGMITIYHGNEEVTYQMDLSEKKSTMLVKHLQSGNLKVLES